MPLDPSPQLLKKMKVGKGPTSDNSPQAPSLLRDIFEGLVDTGLGAVGIGPDSKMNRVGAMLGMALPMSKKLGRYPEIDVTSQIPTQNRLAMGVSPSNGVYDEAGRYLGAAPKVDEAYKAHVASSRGKFSPNKIKIQSTEDSFVNRGDNSSLIPSAAQVEQLIKKYLK